MGAIVTFYQHVITDAELHHAHSVLKRYPNGLTRADLARYFQSDRKGRDLMAALAERGIAPVVTAKADWGDQKVYRLARNEAEVQEEIRTLPSLAIIRVFDAIDRRNRPWKEHQ